MTRETERRFLLDRAPDDLPEGTEVRQGHLAIDGELESLVVAEVEFGSEEEAGAFSPPEWRGTEVTGRPEWSNVSPAVRGSPG